MGLLRLIDWFNFVLFIFAIARHNLSVFSSWRSYHLFSDSHVRHFSITVGIQLLLLLHQDLLSSRDRVVIGNRWHLMVLLLLLLVACRILDLFAIGSL